MFSNNTVVQTYHIFLSETDIENVEKVLFERNNALPEGLEDCDTTEYGNAISFYAKLKMGFWEIMSMTDSTGSSRAPNARYIAISKKIKML
jgi:hypothetical protein